MVGFPTILLLLLFLPRVILLLFPTIIDTPFLSDDGDDDGILLMEIYCYSQVFVVTCIDDDDIIPSAHWYDIDDVFTVIFVYLLFYSPLLEEVLFFIPQKYYDIPRYDDGIVILL